MFIGPGVAIDQYDVCFYFLKHARKELNEQISGTVSKMYCDTKDGETLHVGYVIGGRWLTVYLRVGIPA